LPPPGRKDCRDIGLKKVTATKKLLTGFSKAYWFGLIKAKKVPGISLDIILGRKYTTSQNDRYCIVLLKFLSNNPADHLVVYIPYWQRLAAHGSVRRFHEQQ